MVMYMVEKAFEQDAAQTERARAVAEMFGLGMRGGTEAVVERLAVRIGAGQVVYITGGSGAGKSVILNALKEQMREGRQGGDGEEAERIEAGWGEVVDLAEVALPEGKAAVDCFGEVDLVVGLKWLSMAGLSEAPALVRRVETLSEGQRYRLRLAVALARRPGAIVIDEFCAALDRVTAAVVAFNVRRCADRLGMTFVVATSQDDILEDLSPDVVVVKYLGSGGEVYYPKSIGG